MLLLRFRYRHCCVSVVMWSYSEVTMRPSGCFIVLIWPVEQVEFETLV